MHLVLSDPKNQISCYNCLLGHCTKESEASFPILWLHPCSFLSSRLHGHCFITTFSLPPHTVFSFCYGLPCIFYFILFNFTILYWFCHISKWICHRYTCVPHPEPSSLLPPHTIPLGHPSAPAPSIQYRASILDWQLISYMILFLSLYFCHIKIIDILKISIIKL